MVLVVFETTTQRIVESVLCFYAAVGRLCYLYKRFSLCYYYEPWRRPLGGLKSPTSELATSFFTSLTINRCNVWKSYRTKQLSIKARVKVFYNRKPVIEWNVLFNSISKVSLFYSIAQFQGTFSLRKPLSFCTNLTSYTINEVRLDIHRDNKYQLRSSNAGDAEPGGASR